MALIFLGKTQCALCSAILIAGDELVATTHFIADPSDQLWRFSDAAMHKECFLNWEHMQEFIDKYNAVVGSITWGNGTHHHMTDDGRILSLPRDAAPN